MNWHDRRYSPDRAEHEADIRRADPRLRDLPASQRVALVKLIGYCEGIASSGVLSDPDVEFEFRKIIAENLTVFGMPAKPERDAGHLLEMAARGMTHG